MKSSPASLEGHPAHSTTHPLNPADAAAVAAMRTLLEPLQGKLPDWPERRTGFDQMIGQIPAAPGVSYEPDTIGGVPGWWCNPHNAQPGATLLYFHGGAYVVGSPLAHRNFVGQLAVRARAATFIAGYRLAPEHGFPAPVQDAEACYRGLLERKVGRIAISGASAGGGLGLILLSLATAQAKRSGSVAPVAAAVLSPWTDLTLSGRSLTERAQSDPLLSNSDLRSAARHYLRGHDAADPLVSPLFGDLAGLPPIRVHVGEDEVLLDDSVRYVARAVAAGVDARIDIWQGMLHVFSSSVGRLQASAQALDEVGAFLSTHLA